MALVASFKPLFARGMAEYVLKMSKKFMALGLSCFFFTKVEFDFRFFVGANFLQSLWEKKKTGRAGD